MAFALVCATDPGLGAACPTASLAWVDLQAMVAPDALGVTATQIAYVVGWGFGAVVFMWWLGYVIGCAIKVIGKA